MQVKKKWVLFYFPNTQCNIYKTEKPHCTTVPIVLYTTAQLLEAEGAHVTLSGRHVSFESLQLQSSYIVGAYCIYLTRTMAVPDNIDHSLKTHDSSNVAYDHAGRVWQNQKRSLIKPCILPTPKAKYKMTYRICFNSLVNILYQCALLTLLH